LHRNADTTGSTFWQNALKQGVSRGEVLAGFTNSPEFQSASANKVALTLGYVGLLGQAPDAGALNQALAQNQSGVELIGQLLNSGDYLGRFM